MLKAHSAYCLGTLLLALALSGCGQSQEAAHASGAAVAPPAPPAASAEQAVLQVTQGLANNEAHVVWDALPASYQKDITGLIRDFAAKMDPEIWNQSFATLAKFSDVLKSKKDIILGMSKIQNNPNIDVEEMSRNWDHVVDPLVAITHSDVADLSRLKQVDVRQVLGTTGARVLKDLQILHQVAPGSAGTQLVKLGQTKATLVQENGDSAMVRIEVPGQQPKEERFVQVEGKWIPQEMAQDWSSNMDKARKDLANWSTQGMTEKKPQVMQVITALDGIVDSLAQSNTSEQFEQTLQGGMFQMMGLIMSLSQPQETNGNPSSADARH